MTKNEETILNNLVKTLQEYENECFRQIAFMNERWYGSFASRLMLFL